MHTYHILGQGLLKGGEGRGGEGDNYMGGSVRSTCDTDNHFNLILKIQTQHERSSMKRGEGKGERFNALIKRINL